MENGTDLIVIGGGVLGAFHAYHALAREKSVVLLERNVQPQGASTQNFGQVVPSGMNTTWQTYGRRSLEIYKQIQSRFDVSVVQNGSIYIASNAGEIQLIEELATINRENGYPSQLWTREQCLASYPNLNGDYCKGGLFFPEEMSVNPRILIHRVHDFMQETGGYRYQASSEVVGVSEQQDGRVEVTTSANETFIADKVVICSGHEVKTLFPQLFRESDLELVKLQMMRLKPTTPGSIRGNLLTGLTIRRYESFQTCPSYPQVVQEDDPSEFWKQWGVHILFKQESDGRMILGDSHEYFDATAADQSAFLGRPDIDAYILEEGKKILNLDRWDVEATWNGYYSQCKSQDVFNKRVSENVHVVTGIGGKGMTASAGYAEKQIGEIFDD